MLRAAGFAVLARPAEETWLCTSAARPREHDDEAVFAAARAAAASSVAEERHA
jgi:hypothetical protein